MATLGELERSVMDCLWSAGEPVAATALRDELGGGLALTTHTTKLGLRYAIDTSPEPVTNGATNVAELGLVASLAYFIWNHPFVSLAVAIAILVALIFAVRLIWRALRRVFSGRWMPQCGLMQEPRASARPEPPLPEEL